MDPRLLSLPEVRLFAKLTTNLRAILLAQFFPAPPVPVGRAFDKYASPEGVNSAPRVGHLARENPERHGERRPEDNGDGDESQQCRTHRLVP